MVESLKELNQVCQKPHYKEKGNWMVRTFLRDASLPMTWLLLHTPITANQVTLISLIVGLWGICLFALPSSGAFLFGAILLQLWYYLDHVDGQIARYRKTACLSGRFFDFITHHLIHGVLFFSLGFYAYQKTGGIHFVIGGFIASISIMMFNLIHDTKYKTFFEKLTTLSSIQMKHPAEGEAHAGSKRNEGFLRKGFAFLHKISEIHVLMNILTVSACLQLLTKDAFDFRFVLFAIYVVITPLLAIFKTTYFISSRKIDEEFRQNFG